MIILFWGLILLSAAFLVFRFIVKHDYLTKGKLSPGASFLQLAILSAVIGFPSLFNPEEWLIFWRMDLVLYPWHQWLGSWLIILGIGFAFGTMFWFGLRRAFGLQHADLIRHGPYRFSRNPQILGGYGMVFGVFLQWPSLPALGWMGIYGVVCHLMILTEEEYLKSAFGSAYEEYCREVPRYLPLNKLFSFS
jgi:protein-S-isoprenylcysteine O-methyltransferase Ste14